MKCVRVSFVGMLGCFAMALVLSSCNQEFPNLLNEYEQRGDPSTVTDKVLIILVDGLRGEALQAVDPPFFYLLQRNSLYTYNSIVDPGTGDLSKESAWASLVTGVYSQRHGVVGNDLSTVDFEANPSVFQRVGEDDDRSTAVLTTSASFGSVVQGVVDRTDAFTSDGALTDAFVSQVDELDEDLIVMHFSDVDQVGQANSYESDDVRYTQAITTFDSQMRRVVEALQSRSTYGSENWLVIVTSTIGGDIEEISEDVTAYGDAKRNTFTYFYSPRFSSRYMNKPNYTDIPFSGNSVYFRHSETVQATATDPNSLNFPANQDITIQFFYRDLNPGHDLYYPVLLGKRAGPQFNNTSSLGWIVFREGQLLGVNSASISGNQVFFNPVASDGNWHALTIVFDRTNSTVYAYTDAQLGTTHGNGSQRATNTNALSNNVPLVLGYSQYEGYDNSNLQYTISNLQFYDRAFTPSEVAELYGVVLVDEDHPFYDNLVAYYPGYNDAGGNLLRDVTGKASHLRLTGGYNWYNFNDLVSGFRPPVETSFFRMVPNSVDISFMVYQWMGVRIDQDWALDGRAWSPNYSQIRN